MPPNDSTVKPSRDALMWLNAYGAKRHRVYLGKTVQAMENHETLTDGSNVLYLKDPLEPNQTYFWRVDAELSSNEIYQGDIWKFNVGI